MLSKRTFKRAMGPIVPGDLLCMGNPNSIVTFKTRNAWPILHDSYEDVGTRKPESFRKMAEFEVALVISCSRGWVPESLAYDYEMHHDTHWYRYLLLTSEGLGWWLTAKPAHTREWLYRLED